MFCQQPASRDAVGSRSAAQGPGQRREKKAGSVGEQRAAVHVIRLFFGVSLTSLFGDANKQEVRMRPK